MSQVSTNPLKFKIKFIRLKVVAQVWETQSPMALIVQKYGGTSVGDPAKIKKVAARVAQSYREGNRLVVVVSAMGQTTDDLIDLAHQISSEPSCREMDMLLTAGERISMALLSMALGEERVPAISLTGSQSGIITAGGHRRSRIIEIRPGRIGDGLEQGKVVIVAGFQGVNQQKEITTLGRGGSDTTAVALAAVLGADRCEILTDVDGVYSADPRVVSESYLWQTIPDDLMVEMASRGAGVLHPRCLQLARRFQVPLLLLPSAKQEGGTAIVARNSNRERKRLVSDLKGPLEDFDVVGVTCDLEKMFLSVELSRPGIASCIWDKAAQSSLSVVAPSFAGVHLSFFIERDAELEWKKHLDQLVRDGFINHFFPDRTLVPLTLAGDRFSQDAVALDQVFNTLKESHIIAYSGVASELLVTVAVKSDRAQEAVQLLHRKFVEGNR